MPEHAAIPKLPWPWVASSIAGLTCQPGKFTNKIESRSSMQSTFKGKLATAESD